MREIKLPSSAILKITPASFEESRNLYQAVLEEAKNILIGSRTEMASVYKDLLCVGFSSKKIENCLWECFKKCTYNNGQTGDLKIDKDTFEPVSARDDYLKACMEVAKDNIHPFVKSLYVEYGHIIKMILNDQT
jgi:hypothetical protein